MLDKAAWRKKSASLKTYRHTHQNAHVAFFLQALFTPRLISPARMPLPSLKYDN